MKTLLPAALCGAAIFALPCLHAAQSAPTSPSANPDEAVRIDVHGADGSQFTKEYRDADGRPIDAATFAQGVRNGSTFTPAFDSVKKVITLSLSAAAPADGLAVSIGGKIPDFHLPTLDKRGASSAQMLGKPTLVDFFFSDCVGCIEELPALNAYAAKHPEMNFLAITFDDAGVAGDFVRQRHFKWPVAYDGKPFITRLGVQNFPTMLLFDAHADLIASQIGSIPIEYTRSANDPAQPDQAQSEKLQLQWLDHWVASTVARAHRP